MRMALITTTITVPRVLTQYRLCSSNEDVTFIVAGDQGAPDHDITSFLSDLPGRNIYLSYEAQHDAYPDLSTAIGARSVQRRNFALLDALAQGADIVVTVDDDNTPMRDGWAQEWRFWFPQFPQCMPPRRLVTTSAGWFNPGSLSQPEYSARGLPYLPEVRGSRVTGVELTTRPVGIATGLILGNGDVGAVERVVQGDTSHDYAGWLCDGTDVVLDPRETWAPINTQNTAARRDCAPLLAVWPYVGRYDDILAGYVAQRIMADFGLCVGFGQPLVWQRRHKHDLWRDVEGELFGNRCLPAFLGSLREWRRPEALNYYETPLSALMDFWGSAGLKDVLPSRTIAAGRLFCEAAHKAMESSHVAAG